MFILTSDDVEKVTLDCLEGKFIPEENQKIVKIKFERLSSGIKCNVLLDNIEKKNVTDVVITSDNKSTYTYNSNNIWLLFSIIIAGILISEIIGTILAFTFVIDDFYIMFFHFFNKKSNNIDIVRMKIKSEFGIKLSDLSIEMLNLLHHEKKTLLQISVQLGTPKFITKRRLPLFLFKIPVFIIKHRLKKLEKLELITSDRKIHPKIKEIIDLT
ncbi:MAG: hypothetical protein COW26_01230 [Nitrosopumilales archaeon CG15_BIG_FIL_POST_REV_8_21_14_020_33_23]|nr:MAG: hypothetical protein COW26_01230 [Nitrosopumilales archaeon CG15_BIG_FIL_POST_REV_8_21_14_020_33_23]